MGGCGGTAAFDNPKNLYSYVRSYKNGTYERVYGTATNELEHTIDSIENGMPAEPHLCKRLRDKQEYLHGTYDDKVFIPDGKELSSSYWEVPEPIYKKAGTAAGISGVENRLLRAKRLVSGSTARQLIDQKDRLLQVLGGLETVKSLDLKRKRESSKKREEFENALQANSAFQRLLSRTACQSDVNKLLGDRFFTPISYGSLHFTASHAKWLFKGGKGQYLTIQDLRSSEDMYLYDELTVENSLRVSGIPLCTMFNNRSTVIRPTVKKIGLYEISKTQEEWADTIIQDLKSDGGGLRPVPRENVLEIFSKDPEWINDDSLIISRVIRDYKDKPVNTPIILISEDEKLSRQLSRTMNSHVFLYKPDDIVRHVRREYWTSTSTIDVLELKSLDRKLNSQVIDNGLHVYIDSGSLMASAVKYTQTDPDPITSKRILVKRTLLYTEYKPRRKATYSEERIDPTGYRLRFLSHRVIKPDIGKPRRSSYHYSTYGQQNPYNYEDFGSTLSSGSSSLNWRSVSSSDRSWN